VRWKGKIKNRGDVRMDSLEEQREQYQKYVVWENPELVLTSKEK